jgi:hypothetical protein
MSQLAIATKIQLTDFAEGRGSNRYDVFASDSALTSDGAFAGR